MPLFEYDCTTCGEVVEVLQRPQDPDPQRCGDDCVCAGPRLGEGELVRRLSLPGGYAVKQRGQVPREKESCGHCGEEPGSVVSRLEK